MSAVLRSQMPKANVRVAVLMSPAQKRRLARKAKAANLTMGELLRQGGERFSPAEDDAALDQFVKRERCQEPLFTTRVRTTGHVRHSIS